MRQARRNIVLVLVWAVILAVLVHVDWHVGRPGHMRLSLDWPFHWLLGLAAGAGMGWLFLRRRGHGGAERMLAFTGGLGLVLGQVVEPALEVVAYGETFEAVYPAVRWELFAAFAAAWVAGAALAVAVSRWRRRAHVT